MSRSLTATFVRFLSWLSLVARLDDRAEVAELGGHATALLALLAPPAHERGHGAHHLLHLLELAQEVVDVGRGHAAAVRDPRPARSVDDRRVVALGAGHRLDDGLDAG